MIELMARPRKKLYLINRDFQLRYSLAAAGVGIGTTLLSACVLLYPLYAFEILRIPRFLPLPVLLGMFLATILNVGMVGLLGIFITHRIAGPMYSLVRCFRRIEMGQWAGHLRIREKDDLRYVVRNFNVLVDGLLAQGRADVAVLDDVIDKLESGAETGTVLTAVINLRDSINDRLKERPVEGQVLADSRGAQDDLQADR
jgi:hypothetical protein